MRLAEFILANVEPILAEWETFAHSIWPAPLINPTTDPATLRDHAEEILCAAAREMVSDQTTTERSDKSKGARSSSSTGLLVDRASERHGSDRVGSGFELWAVVAEYRALRASVIRLWRESGPQPDLRDLDDLARFNESMDQSLTESVRSYSGRVERDREALKATEQAARIDAEVANRAKDMFLATLSHEMRTPLNAIVGWISILRLSGGEANLAEGLDVIERNTRAQAQLIEDVLDVSRIVSGKLRLELSNCDLIALINSGMDSVRPAAQARNITLALQLDTAEGHAWCDATRIQQVVWNLLSNAIKFTSKGGAVLTTLVREQSGFRIEVSDNGQGISAELLPYVFERFRQADTSSRRKFGGLGLGLSIVKHLAELHGGTVEAKSLGEGLGATFIVHLPIRAVIEEVDIEDSSEEHVESPQSNASSNLTATRLDGLHVFVVDDEADARQMLLKVLEAAGARVTTAAGAADALADRNEPLPDVLVSDVGMPEQNGYDLIREVRRSGHRAEMLPAVALTAFAHTDDALEATSAGFQLHISKPVNVRDLTAAIASLAGRSV